RNQELGSELILHAISHGDYVRRLGHRKFRDRAGGRKLHLLVDSCCADVERTAKYEWETKDVVDLIGVVGTTRGNDAVGAHLARRFGSDLRVWVGERENQRPRRH